MADADNSPLRQALRIPLDFALSFLDDAQHLSDRALLAWAHITGQRRRITRVRPARDNRYVIIATFGRSRLNADIERVARAAHEQGLDVVLVYSGKLDRAYLRSLGDVIHVLVERPNIGRDFGGFQDGVRYLQRLKTRPTRVVFANDSVFFLPKQIEPLLAALNQDAHAFVAATDNSEFNYHVGSFLFAVSGAVFASKAFRKFWRGYFPYSTRRHVIHRGELGLSRQLMRKGGFIPHVLCPGSAVGAVLRTWTPEDLRANFFTFSNDLREMIQASQLLRIYEERGVVMATDAGGAALASSASHEQTAARSIALVQLLDRMIEKVERGNGIHVAGALMAKHLNLGIVKKDLAYREVMNMTEVIRLMDEIGYPDLDFVKADLRKRGTYASMKGIQKLQFRRGFI